MSGGRTSFFCWNCREAGNSSFLRNAKELMKLYRPKILAVLEPRISGNTAQKVCKKLGRKNWCLVEAEGFSKEIWVLWDGDDIEVSLILVHKQFIHLAINRGKENECQLSIVYASPRPSERIELWEELGSNILESPWSVMGDFNATLREDEWLSPGRPLSTFQEWVRSRGLVDLGYDGPEFTWSHGREINQRKAGRQDRVLADNNWLRKFLEASILHCTPAYSDHCPLLLNTHFNRGGSVGAQPFRFEAA